MVLGTAVAAAAAVAAATAVVALAAAVVALARCPATLAALVRLGAPVLAAATLLHGQAVHLY